MTDLFANVETGKPAAPVTMWVRTGTGLVETTMPRPVAMFVAGRGKPTSKDGVEGSVYLDTAAGIFYGPRVGNLWPAIGKLQNIPKVAPK